MSWNNITPAKFLFDQAKETELSRADYVVWLKQQIEETDDSFYRRRLEIVANDGPPRTAEKRG